MWPPVNFFNNYTNLFKYGENAVLGNRFYAIVPKYLLSARNKWIDKVHITSFDAQWQHYKL